MATTPMNGTELALRLPKPLTHQKPILLNPARFKLVVCGRRWGKTALALMALIRGHGPKRGERGHWPGMIDGGTYWWVARSNTDAFESIWGDLIKLFEPLEPRVKINRNLHHILLPNGAELSVKSAQQPEGLRSVGLNGLVCDEAAFYPHECWTGQLRPTLIDRNGWCIFITTPCGHNWIYDLFESAPSKTDWARWQRPTSDNPLIPPYELVEARRENAVKYRQEYEADFESVVGTLFRREWFTIVEDWPRQFDSLVRYWDKAATAKDTADYSAGVLIGANQGFMGREFTVVNVVRGQWSIDERERRILQVANLDRENFGDVKIWIEQEGGSAGPESARNTINRLAGFSVRAEPVSGKGSKEVRAQPLASQLQAGFVKLAKGYWNHEFIDECVAFPNPKVKDDQVDAASGAFAKVARSGRFEVAVY